MIALMILIEPVEIDEVAIDQYDIKCPGNRKRIVGVTRVCEEKSVNRIFYDVCKC